MEKYDAVFLGFGVTAAAVMQHYWLKSKMEGRYLLINDLRDPQGAFSKGVKTVNLIVPKLPALYAQNKPQYQSIIQLLRGAVGGLEEVFSGSPAYLGQSTTGFRVCRFKEEMGILRSLNGTGGFANEELIRDTAKFLSMSMGMNVDKGLLFPYEEKIWDVDLYREIIKGSMPYGLTLDAEEVEVEPEGNGIGISVKFHNNERKIIHTKHLVVCKGIGNLQFESDMCAKFQETTNLLGFQVLPFSKIVYNGPQFMPNDVTSIMLPTEGVCVTREQSNEHSLLYNTNASPISASGLNIRDLGTDPQVIHEQLCGRYPLLPKQFNHAFNCAMTIDRQAYTNNGFNRHFKFIRSQSVMKNVYYLNLPYFSVINIALQYLPNQIKDFNNIN